MRLPSAENRVEALPRQRLAVMIRIVNDLHEEEATLQKLVTPKIEMDHELSEVRLISQGLTLKEERRIEGQDAIIIELAARYRLGEGAIKQQYRYLVFKENGHVYCQRLPMGSWAPSDPDACLIWLGRGGLQQGDFVLLPRKRIPKDAEELLPPADPGFWKKLRQAVTEAFSDNDPEVSEWERIIGRHHPLNCQVYRKENRVYLLAEAATIIEHPEHAPLEIPAGVYEVVEDRASAYWRKAID